MSLELLRYMSVAHKNIYASQVECAFLLAVVQEKHSKAGKGPEKVKKKDSHVNDSQHF